MSNDKTPPKSPKIQDNDVISGKLYNKLIADYKVYDDKRNLYLDELKKQNKHLKLQVKSLTKTLNILQNNMGDTIHPTTQKNLNAIIKKLSKIPI